MGMRRVLLAGGSGFVGSHIADALIARGDKVLVVDNFISGRPANVEHLAGNRNFDLAEMDAARATELPGRFDLVMHFASPASPPRYMAHPLETLHAGSRATEALLDVARRDGARFVVASTSEIYGDPLQHPQTEEYWGNVNPNGPRSVYDEAKRYAEAVTAAYRRTFGVDTAILRIFNTYGPRMDPLDGRAVPAFIEAALAGNALPLHGDGLQTRSLTYIDDLVRGVLLLADSDHPGPINIGNPREQTLLEIARLIISLTQSTSKIEYLPRPVDDPSQRRPDISLATRTLGWTPTIASEDGLRMTIDWFESREHTPARHSAFRGES